MKVLIFFCCEIQIFFQNANGRSNEIFTVCLCYQDSNQTGGCRHGHQGDTSRPESTTPYSSLERSVTDRACAQQPQQQLLPRTPPAPSGVQWARQKSTPSGDCFDPTSRRLLMYHGRRSNDDSTLPATFVA